MHKTEAKLVTVPPVPVEPEKYVELKLSVREAGIILHLAGQQYPQGRDFPDLGLPAVYSALYKAGVIAPPELKQVLPVRRAGIHQGWWWEKEA